MKTNWNLKSTLRAAALSLALAFGVTAGQAIVHPDTAQAGIVGGLKSAAKKVGSSVKKAAVTVGSAGKAVGVGVGKTLKEGAGALGRTPPIKQVGGAVKKTVLRVVR